MKTPHRRTFRRSLVLLTSVFLALGLGTASAFAESYSDTAGHWGAPAIEKWSGYDVLQGNGDGTFAPDRDTSIAELATVLVRTFGYVETGDPEISPSVPSWAADNVRKAVTAGVLSPDETGAALTRELAAKILADAFGIAPVSGASGFADDGDIAAAYRPYAAALGERGVFKGDASGNFMPKKAFTRAEIMQTLDNAVADVARADRPADSDGSVIVNKAGVSLTAGTVKGDVIIGQGVGDGDVTLTDVRIEGRLIVYGGGGNSVHIKGASVIPTVIVNKTFGEPARIAVESASANVGTVSVVAESKASVAGDIAKLEVVPAVAVTAAGELADVAPTGETNVVIGSGSIIAVSVTAEGAAVAVEGGATITTLSVAGENANITVSVGASISAATISVSGVTIEGAGKVISVTVTADSAGGVTVSVSGAQIKNDSGADVSAGDGNTVAPGTGTGTPAGGGGGGGGGNTGGNAVVNAQGFALLTGYESTTSSAIASVKIFDQTSREGTYRLTDGLVSKLIGDVSATGISEALASLYPNASYTPYLVAYTLSGGELSALEPGVAVTAGGGNVVNKGGTVLTTDNYSNILIDSEAAVFIVKADGGYAVGTLDNIRGTELTRSFQYVRDNDNRRIRAFAIHEDDAGLYVEEEEEEEEDTVSPYVFVMIDSIARGTDGPDEFDIVNGLSFADGGSASAKTWEYTDNGLADVLSAAAIKIGIESSKWGAYYGGSFPYPEIVKFRVGEDNVLEQGELIALRVDMATVSSAAVTGSGVYVNPDNITDGVGGTFTIGYSESNNGPIRDYASFEANTVMYKIDGPNWTAVTPDRDAFTADIGPAPGAEIPEYIFLKTDPDKAYDIIIKAN